MLISKENRRAIYEHLFKEGVMVAKKDFRPHNHPELETIPNLQVIKTMQSLKSRGYVIETFSWQSYYWNLTNEGIQYLGDFLHLPSEIVPSTMTRQEDKGPPGKIPQMVLPRLHVETQLLTTKTGMTTGGVLVLTRRLTLELELEISSSGLVVLDVVNKAPPV